MVTAKNQTEHRTERRGRRRNQEIDVLCVEAAIALLVEEGARSVTFDAVAKRAGVSIPSVYRRWSSAHDLLWVAMRKISLDAAMRENAGPPYSIDGLPFKQAIQQTLKRLNEIYSEPKVRISLLSIAAMAPKDAAMEGGIEQYKAHWEQRIQAFMRPAAEVAGVSVQTLSSLLIGAVFYRSLFLGSPLTQDDIASIADFIEAGCGAKDVR